MRNEAMTALDVLAGQWRTTISDAGFLEDGLGESAYQEVLAP